MSIKGLIVSLFVILAASAAQAEGRYADLNEFAGSWHNVKFKETQVIRLEIRPVGPKRYDVTVFGLRGGHPHSFGTYPARLFEARDIPDRENDESAVLVRVDRGFVHGHVLLRMNRRGGIVSHALLHFEDRGPIYSVERFTPAANGHRDIEYGEEEYRRARDPYAHRHFNSHREYHHRRREIRRRYSERY